MTTWREEISQALVSKDESWDDVVASTLNDEQLYHEFNDYSGLIEGCSFTLWTKKRVYFPACYDGAEWVESVPRDPCDEETHHIGVVEP